MPIQEMVVSPQTKDGSITTLSMTTLRMKTLSVMRLFAKLTINDTQNNSMECHCAECSVFHARCHYAECRGAILVPEMWTNHHERSILNLNIQLFSYCH